MANPPSRLANCATCGQHREVQFSTVRGYCGTLLMAPGLWPAPDFKHHCSLECVARELGAWAAKQETQPPNLK